MAERAPDTRSGTATASLLVRRRPAGGLVEPEFVKHRGEMLSILGHFNALGLSAENWTRLRLQERWRD